jgi:CHAT domain-containing protein
MLRRFVLLCGLIFLFSRPQSQQHAAAAPYLDHFKKAEALFNSESADETTDSLALQHYQQIISSLENRHINDTVLFTSFLRSSVLLTAAGEDEQSLRLLQRSIALNQSSAMIADSASFLPWIFAGSNYYSLYNSDSALICYREAEEIYRQYPNVPEAERLFNKTGVLFYEAGDFRKSIPYFSKALALVDSSGMTSKYFVVNYNNNIASAYRKLQEYDRALEIYQSLLPLHVYEDELRHNIGITYLEDGNAEAAIRYLRQVGYRNATIYNDLAKAYILHGNADTAVRFLDLAYKTYAPNLVQDRPDHAITLKASGDLLSLQGKYTEAIRYYHHAILEIYPVFKDSTITANPLVFKGTYNFYFLFDALTSKARNYEMLYRQTRKVENLELAFSTYEAAILLSSHMERLYGTDESRLFVKRTAELVYNEVVEAGIELASIHKDTVISTRLFAIIENSKASVLEADVYTLALNNVKGMPVTLLSQERAHKSLLSALQLKLAQASDSSTIALLRSQIEKSSIELTHVQEQLDQSPAYQALRFANRHPDPALIRQELVGPEETILSFYLTKKHLVCFYISQDGNGFVVSNVDSNLVATIRELRAHLLAEDGGNLAQFKTLSSSLFQSLISPALKRMPLHKHLVIIPHKEISYIPFEMLTDDDGQPMVKNYSISYQYSTNFLTSDHAASILYSVLSVAPFASHGGNNLPALPASGEEVEALPGRLLKDSTATKQAFERWVSEYPVIHLATHARADDTLPANSFISFFGNDPDSARLYEPGIYQLDLSATRLAILSACETGSGKMENSEGIISLSRAFTYAGCHSVITSLWKANDKATAFISRQLHYYLGRGYRLDEALQLAKSDYLDSDEIDARFKKPSYWATLVLTGDPTPITRRTNWRLAAGLVMIVLIIALAWRLKRKQVV